MKRKTLVILLIAGCLLVGPADAATKRILIVGDSWATSISAENHEGFPAPDVFDDTLKANGLGEYETQGAVTAWGGRRASHWAKQENLDLIIAELAKYPTIDIVHLITGGNDFLGATGEAGFRSKTPEERDAIWTGIQSDIQTIVDGCLAVRDAIRVVIADYDYLDTAAAEKFWGPVNGMTYHGATITEFNTWMIELGRKKLEVARKTPRCEYVQNWGTLQYWFGTPVKAVPYPGKAPDYTPYPGGDIHAPMPAGISPDGIHPNAEAHAKLLQNAIDQYYRAWLTGSAGVALPEANHAASQRDAK